MYGSRIATSSLSFRLAVCARTVFQRKPDHVSAGRADQGEAEKVGLHVDRIDASHSEVDVWLGTSLQEHLGRLDVLQEDSQTEESPVAVAERGRVG